MPTTRTGWHSGIHSAVRLSAAMAAMRAVASTSPLPRAPVPAATSASVAAFMRTGRAGHPSRRVSALAPTSTMCAAPRESTWLRRARMSS